MTAPATITVVLPTSHLLNLNAERRMHHHERARIVKHIRTEVAGLAASIAPLTSPVVIRVTYRWPDRHRRDSIVGNWTPLEKAAVDGLVDAGVIVDDSDAHVTQYVRGPNHLGGISPGYAALTVSVEEVRE